MADNYSDYKKLDFPNPLATDAEKKEEVYGIGFAKKIEQEWWGRNDGGSNQESFYEKRIKYHKLRLYARGEQSKDIYKDLITGGDESSYTNYDFRPLQIVPKFVKLLSNQMTERLFSIKAEAVDNYSTDLKNKHQKELESLIDTLPLRKEAEKQLGVKLVPDNIEDMPATDEEVSLHMKLKYKTSIEIAGEESLKFTLALNDFDEVQSRVVEDLVILGIGAFKYWTDPTKGILIEWVDPADCVYSYPKHKNFKEVHYFGQVDRITIPELKRLSGNKFTKDALKKISSIGSEWNRYSDNGDEVNQTRENSLSGMVDVLNFTFKSSKTLSYKKKYSKNGGFKMIKKESTFSKGDKEHKGFDVVKKVIDVWYEGTLILGTEYIFNYKMCENMVRPKGYLDRTLPSYIFYAPELYQNRTRSLVGRIIPYVDGMQQIHIKIQQLVAKSRPPGVYIDVDGLTDISMGEGAAALTPLELIKIYDQTGNIIGTSKDISGDYNHGKEPIRELRNGIVDGLDKLIGLYNHYLTLLRDAIGIPQGVDASTPHPKMAVGVQENLANSSNTATRHILDSILNMTERLGEGLALRIKDIFEYSDLKEAYINAIGKINVGVLEALKKYHLHDLGIIIELKPDSQEKQLLEQNIQVALSKDTITLDDAIDIRAVKNTKLANSLLKISRGKREKAKKRHELKVIEKNNEGQQKTAQAAAEGKQQELQALSQIALQEIDAKTKGKLAEITAEKEAKLELMEEEFNYNMSLRKAETAQSNEVKRYDNDRKDSRQRESATQTSRTTEQKMQNKPAIDFESGHDSITGGLGLEDIQIT